MLWRNLIERCLRETNSDRLIGLVYQTEEAIFLRSQELAREAQPSDEEEGLREAARQLLELKIKKLGWRDPLKINTELNESV